MQNSGRGNSELELITGENAMAKRRTLLDILESVCLALKETGQQSQLANYGLAAVATRRARHSRAASTPRKRGRTPRELPFDDIHHMRRRKLTWADIRDRLEAGGVRISVGRLFTRYQLWIKSRKNWRKNCTISKTVTRS